MINIKKWLITLSMLLIANIAYSAQTFGCLIEPYQTAEVGSEVVGVIKSINVERGESVKKGQVIAYLRANVEHAAMKAAETRAQAKANVNASQANYQFDLERLKRGKGLLKKNFISKQALDKIDAETKVSYQKYKQAKEQQQIAVEEHKIARSQLSQRSIKSPFDGVITDRYLSVGERIEEKPIVKLAQINKLRVQVVVPVSQFGKIQADDMATITPEFPNAPEVIAKVAIIDKVIDAASNTFRVQLEIDNQDLSLPAGARCKADFGTSEPAETGL